MSRAFFMLLLTNLFLSATLAPAQDRQNQEDLRAELKNLRLKLEELTHIAKANTEIIQKLHQSFMVGPLLELIVEAKKKKDPPPDANFLQLKFMEERLFVMEKQLQDAVRSYAAKLVALETERKAALEQAVETRGELLIMQQRYQELWTRFVEIMEADGKVLRLEKRNPQDKNPNAPNPPQGYVKGVIEKIDKGDRPLVRLSIGSDHGLVKGHTLEVFRLKPRPAYLGRIRIIECDPLQSIARVLLTDMNLPRPQLQEGDIVASSLDGPTKDSDKNNKERNEQ